MNYDIIVVGSGPGGYQLPAGARPLTSGNAAARVGATPVTPPTTPAATPAAATPAAKPRAQVRGREAMMAAQRDRARQSSQKPVATTPVTAPATPAAAKSKLSIADRLQQIRDMRARSQSRITAQGGKPATPAVQPKTQPAAAQPATQPKVQPAAQPKVQPTTNPNQQSSLNNTVQSGTGGSPSGSDRAAEIRAKADAARQRLMQNASPALQSTLRDLRNRRNAARNRAAGKTETPMTVTTGSGANATTTTYAAGTSKSDPNLAAEIKTTKNLIKKGSGIPTGDTIKTKMNPDSSLRVTQTRNPEATKKIRDSLNLF